MGFTLLDKKGLSKCFIDKDIDPEKFSMHISEIELGASSHAAHAHDDIEAIYVFSGKGTVEVETQEYPVGPNETMVIDASKTHSLTNTGTEPLRYMVVKISSRL